MAKTSNQRPATKKAKAAQASGAAAGGRFIRNVLRLVLLVAGVAILILIFLPAKVPAEGFAADAEAVKRVRATLLDLDDAVRRDTDFEGTVSETDLNAYLYDVVKARNQAKGLKPDSVMVDVEAGHMDMAMVAHVGFLPISYKVTLTPENEDGDFSVVPSKASVGRLPLPGPMANLVRSRFENLFAGMTSEASLFESLGHLEPRAGEVLFRSAPATEPVPAPAPEPEPAPQP